MLSGWSRLRFERRKGGAGVVAGPEDEEGASARAAGHEARRDEHAVVSPSDVALEASHGVPHVARGAAADDMSSP